MIELLKSCEARQLRRINYVDAITIDMTSVDHDDLFQELGRLIGDFAQPDQNSVQISVVLQRHPNVSENQLHPLEEVGTDPQMPPPQSDSEPEIQPDPLPPTQLRPATNKPKVKSFPTSVLPRNLFEDSWNSFWHVVFGFFAVKIPSLVPIFLVYQILDRHDVNVFIDILEFTIGHAVAWIFTLL